MILHTVLDDAAQHKSDFEVPQKDTPYLSLWGVYLEDFEENWLHYNSNALYLL